MSPVCIDLRHFPTLVLLPFIRTRLVHRVRHSCLRVCYWRVSKVSHICVVPAGGAGHGVRWRHTAPVEPPSATACRPALPQVQQRAVSMRCTVNTQRVQTHNKHTPSQNTNQGGQMADRLGSWAINQKVVGSNDVVSLGKALHPTCLGENVPVLTVNRSG